MTAVEKKLKHQRKWNLIIKQKELFIIFLLPFIYFVIFYYVPMYGIIISFKDYYPGDSILKAPWVGMTHFYRFFQSFEFGRLLKNTLGISIYSLIIGTVFPIILAISLNEMGNERYKKFAQTVTYAPHFISVVVMAGMIVSFTSPTTGLVNILIEKCGGTPLNFMGTPKYFKHIYVWTNIWQNAGWGSIIYIAALAGIDPAVYEAAKVDGANKLQKIWNIDIPGIMPTIITVLIMNLGRIMNLGYQKILLLQNSLNMPASSVIQTYVYQVGLLNAQFSYAAAIGLFNNIINLILIVVCNRASRKLNDVSLW